MLKSKSFYIVTLVVGIAMIGSGFFFNGEEVKAKAKAGDIIQWVIMGLAYLKLRTIY